MAVVGQPRLKAVDRIVAVEDGRAQLVIVYEGRPITLASLPPQVIGRMRAAHR